MILVEIINNQIVLKDSDDSLNAVHKSQLSFWMLSYDINKDSYLFDLNEEVFFKITNYFDKENIDFILSEEAKKYSERIEMLSYDFHKSRSIADAYKKGHFDKLEFSEFKQFVITNIQRNLKNHQLKAAFHLYKLGSGANFSVPGSGKTSVVLTVYEKLKQEGKVETLFVVGPPSCFGPWKTEFLETLGRNSSAIILAGGNKINRTKHYKNHTKISSELFLTSFQSLLSDQTEVSFFLNHRKGGVFFVIDEAHYIKQINGNWANAILRQAKGANFRCVLTGTPMPKSYSDIFNLFDFLWPQNFPLSANDKTIIKSGEHTGNRHLAKTILDNNIGPLFYRVRKSDLNLTEQIFLTPQKIKMGKYESKIYEAIYTRIKNYSKEEYFKNVDFISKIGRGRIIRLRQAVSYIRLLDTAIEDYKERFFKDDASLKEIVRNYDEIEIPNKIKVLIKKVKKIVTQNEKVVIWSNFIQTLKLIEKKIKAEGINCKIIYGNTPVEGTTLVKEETREKIRDEFLDLNSGLDVLVANPAACAESISLHKTCHNAIYYDLSYNCAQYLQSLDRIHRVGGSEFNTATYHFLQYSDTIDEDIKLNIDRKSEKMFEVIEQEYPIYSLDMAEEDEDFEAYKRIFMKNFKDR